MDMSEKIMEEHFMTEIEKLIQQKKFYDALAYTEHITDEFYKGQILSQITENLISKNEIIEEEDIIDEIVQSILRMRKNKYKSLIKINKILISKKRFHKSSEIINLMGSSEYTAEALDYLCENLNRVTSTISNIKKLYDKLGYIASKIRVPEFQSNAMKSLITHLAKNQYFDKSISLLNKIKDKKTKEFLTGTIAIEIAITGDFERALNISEKVKKSKIKASVVRAIIDSLIRFKGDFDSYEKIIKKLILITDTIKNEYEKNGALRDIAIGIAKLGELNKAVSITEKINDTFWKSDSLMNISINASKQQKYLQAENIAMMIVDERKKHRALNSISKTKK